MSGAGKNFVILSVSAGSGHMRAAAAIRSALLEADPGCGAIVLDTFKYTSPLLERLILGAYMEMLKFTPAVYGYLYSRSEKGRPLSGFAKAEFNKLLSRFSAGRLLDFISRYNPGAVICTHPFPLGVLSAIRSRMEPRLLTVGVVTDFIIHPYWVFPEVDLYLVGAEKLAADLAGYGIPPERICVTGIPIDPVFANPESRDGVLAHCGMNPGLPTILVMGGGLGLGPLAESAYALGAIGDPCQIIVVTGNNAHLKEKISQMTSGLPNRVCVLGYVDSIYLLMSASDIMVSKAGGLSCAEALAKGLPLFILDPLPGQEERNSRFLTSEGAAVEVSGVPDLVEKIVTCLRNPERLREMSRAAVRIGRPDAAKAAAGLISGMVENCLDTK